MRGLIEDILRPFHLGCILSIISSLFVLSTYLSNRERRRHPASLIALRAFCDLVLAIIWLSTSLDWSFTRDDCENSGFKAVAVIVEFVVIASESLIACVSFDLLINAGDAFSDYVGNFVSYIFATILAASTFAIALAATEQDNVGASFLPVCWIKYRGGKIVSNSNVPMSIFFYIPWSLFFLLSIASLARACVFLSVKTVENGARSSAMIDARRVIFAHASYYGLMLIFYAPLVNAMTEDDDANSLSRKQAVLMSIVRFLSGARAIENLLVWFPKVSAKKKSSGPETGGNTDLSPMLNVEMQRDVLMCSVIGMVMSLKARQRNEESENEIEAYVNLRGLDAHSAATMLSREMNDDVEGLLLTSSAHQVVENQQQQQQFAVPLGSAAESTRDYGTISEVDEPNLTTLLIQPQQQEQQEESSHLSNDVHHKTLLSRVTSWFSKEETLLFVSVAPIQVACFSSGLIAIVDKNEPSYVSVLFLTGFVLVALVTFVSYKLAFVQLERRSRAIVSEIKGKSFGQLRRLWNISENDLVRSLAECASKDSKFRLSGGRSGAFMFFSPDHKYVIKTIPKKEMDTLTNRILPGLIAHVIESCPEFTSLARVFACFSLAIFGREMFVVILENVQFGNSDTTKYDLKGSWINRSSSRPVHGKLYICDACGKPFILGKKEMSKCVLSLHGHIPKRLLKDNEFRERILGSPTTINKIKAQIARDVAFLANLGIMDYSLLLCVRRRVLALDGIQAHQAIDGFHPKSRLLLSTVVEGASAFQFGIIDWFTLYDRSKQLEYVFKTRMMCKNERDSEQGFEGISAVDPVHYRNRFMARVVDVVFPVLTDVVQLVDKRHVSDDFVLSIALDVSEVKSLNELLSIVSQSTGSRVDVTRDELVCLQNHLSLETPSANRLAAAGNSVIRVVDEMSFAKFKEESKRSEMCSLVVRRRVPSTT